MNPPRHRATAGAGDGPVAFGVGVPPRAQRGQRQLDRHPGGRGDEPVHDGDAVAAVGHRDLAFQDDLTDPPAPPGYAVRELEVLQVVVTGRVERAGRPLVHGEAHDGTTGQGEDGVERGEREVPLRV